MKRYWTFSLLVPISLVPLTVISCAINLAPVNGKDNIHHQWLDHNPDYFSNEVNASGQSNYILSIAFYNQLYSDPDFDHTSEITIAIIANQNIYTEIIDVTSQEPLSDVLQRLYYLKVKVIKIGFDSLWLSTFSLRQEDNTFTSSMHGLNEHQNYNDYYPLYWVNHQYAQLGALQWRVEPGDIYELSYDTEL